MTINKNSVEQINVALLDMDKKIKSAISNGTSASDFKNLEASVDNIKSALNETKAGLESGKTYNINISGNAATADKATTATTAETATNANHAETATTAEAATNANHALTADNVETANKVSNALTVNGKTYNGSEAVDAGVQTVVNGGTGVTTQADINKAFVGGLDVGTSDVTDGTEFVSSYASDSGFSSTDENSFNTPYRRKFSAVWGYIKGKISSVLGLTKDNYGGKASTAGTADVLANGSGKLKFFYAYSNNSKKLLKLGTFGNGTEASFLLTVKRTDGLGFTGYLTINSNSLYSTNIKQFNGYKSSYTIYEITNGELVFLYRNNDNTNDVYIWCPSYGVVSIILMCGKNPWSGGMDTDVTLTEVSGFSGTLLDKF